MNDRRRRQRIHDARIDRASQLLDEARDAPNLETAIARILEARDTARNHLPIGGGHAVRTQAEDAATYLVAQLQHTGWTQ